METFAIGQTHFCDLSFVRVWFRHIQCMLLFKGFHFVIFHCLSNLVFTLYVFSHSVIKFLLLIVQFVELNLNYSKILPFSKQLSYFGQLKFSFTPLWLTEVCINRSISYFGDQEFNVINLFTSFWKHWLTVQPVLVLKTFFFAQFIFVTWQVFLFIFSFLAVSVILSFCITVKTFSLLIKVVAFPFQLTSFFFVSLIIFV